MNTLVFPAAYTRAQILRATLIALLVAALLTVLVILPAEFGRDPTGFGRLTGLSALSRASGKAAVATAANEPAPATNPAVTAAAGNDAVVDATAAGTPPALTQWAHAHDGLWQSGHFEVTLKGDEEAEYKTKLGRGEPLFYRWRVRQGSKVYFEFHGEPAAGRWPKDYFESYEKGEGTGGQGSLLAPFTGIHGWYWVNLSEKPVTIDVDLVGYYAGFGRIGAAAQ